MRSFDVPEFYRSPLISAIKSIRQEVDPRKKEFSPTLLDFGTFELLLPRHFGFCYGVENAIEIAYATIEKADGKPVYFLSEMIHNPAVNADLKAQGIDFVFDTKGKQLLSWESLSSDAIILIPAFGTSVEMQKELQERGYETAAYDTTCPFVVKVWNRAEKIAEKGYSVVIHGKVEHEETRATFSHCKENAQAIVVRNPAETELLAAYIEGRLSADFIQAYFTNQVSVDFDPEQCLDKFGVVNQTTMLASETQGIAARLKTALASKYQEEDLKAHFADTRDTLCYATNDNQTSNVEMLGHKADFAIIVGGYNSSNTSHLVELSDEKLPTYFVNSPNCLISSSEIVHFDLHTEMEITTSGYLSRLEKPKVLFSSGASCPDALLEEVIRKFQSFLAGSFPDEMVLEKLRLN